MTHRPTPVGYGGEGGTHKANSFCGRLGLTTGLGSRFKPTGRARRQAAGARLSRVDRRGKEAGEQPTRKPGVQNIQVVD